MGTSHFVICRSCPLFGSQNVEHLGPKNPLYISVVSFISHWTWRFHILKGVAIVNDHILISTRTRYRPPFVANLLTMNIIKFFISIRHFIGQFSRVEWSKYYFLCTATLEAILELFKAIFGQI